MHISKPTSSGVAYAHMCKVLIFRKFYSCKRLSSPCHTFFTLALQIRCPLRTLVLLLNYFDVELLFTETPTSLAGVDNLRSLFTKQGEAYPLSTHVLSMGGPFCII